MLSADLRRALNLADEYKSLLLQKEQQISEMDLTIYDLGRQNRSLERRLEEQTFKAKSLLKELEQYRNKY